MPDPAPKSGNRRDVASLAGAARGRLDLVLGCGQFGGSDWGPFDEESATAAVEYALEAGMLFFDTADVYGLGGSEEFLARALGERRHSLAIMTKGGVAWGDVGSTGRASTRRDNSREYLAQALRSSLARLRMASVPIYVVHWPDGITPLDDLLETLAKFKAEGTIRAAGLSNFPAEAIMQLAATNVIDMVQIGVNLMTVESSRPALAAAAQGGLPVFAYAPLGHGVLTGRYSRHSRFPDGDYRKRLPAFDRLRAGAYDELLEVLREVGAAHSCPQAAVSLNWARQQRGVSSVIVGARSKDQLTAHVDAANVCLASAEVDALTAAAVRAAA